ncbi:sensor histidine kinase [Brevundimonas sp. 2R-24]|uniref:histidine kinase n=1 Tax=Peiella sedimenti TaxID=3061083 RepID=A0ABT8SHX0_9CAUL|nr:sensor histidine kinase [Caulobacteraceae bacterium XZ-24]
MPRGSLARRLILLAAAWSLAALVLTGAALTAFFRDASLQRLDQSNQETLDAVVAVANVVDGEVVVPQIRDEPSLRIFSGKYWLVAEAGEGERLTVLEQSTSLWDGDLPLPRGRSLNLEESGPDIYGGEGPRGEPLRIMAIRRTLPNRSEPLIFLAGIDRTAVNADVRRFSTLTWTALALLGCGLVAAVFFQVRLGLRPLHDLSREVGAVRRGRSSAVEGAYPVEIAPLAEELNALLEHNREVVERQRMHVGNLAHALKTPISVMLAESEGKSDGLADVVRRQAEVMRGQVDHHLRRARAAARAQGGGQRTQVEEVLDELARMLERVFQSKGVEIDWDAEPDLWFRGERQDLQEILGNVLENACKWSRRRISAVAVADGETRLRIVIEDDGPGLAADQREQALKRGERLDENAPGSGLGLSIVKELCAAYGGTVALGESRLGGLAVTLELPRAEA